MNDAAVAPRAGLAFVVIDGRMSKINLDTGRSSAGPKLGLQAVSAAALSGDGRLLAAADGEESLVLWDLRRDRPVRRINAGTVLRIAFDADARLVATLTAEGLMGVWDVGSGTKLGEVQLPEHGDTISPDRGVETALRFSPDGDLWTATTGGRIIRWAMSPEAWARSVCRTVNRSLSQAEWEHYIGTNSSPQFSCAEKWGGRRKSSTSTCSSWPASTRPAQGDAPSPGAAARSAPGASRATAVADGGWCASCPGSM